MDNPPTVAGINDPIDPMLGPHSSLMQWPFKLIYWYESGETELFNLESDPSEQVNLVEPDAARGAELLYSLSSMLEESNARLPTRDGESVRPVVSQW